MAHELENARSMIYVGETPWHKLGVKLDAPPTSAEAMRLAGMDWQVGLKPLFTASDDNADAVGEQVTHKATYRMSDGKILGVVGPGWHPLQNAEAFSWFDPFLQAGEASIETAGSLKGGRRVWVLAKINRAPSVIVPGDEIQKYVLLANAHDGTIAARVGYTPIRVVCNNTLHAAVHGKESALFKVRHTKGIVDAIEAVRDTMNVVDGVFEATAEQYRRLARHQISAKDLQKYISRVFPNAKAPGEQSAPAPAADDFASLLARPIGERGESEVGPLDLLQKGERVSRYFGEITELFETGQGAQLPGVRGSLWAAYNAVTEFATHKRGRSDENRLLAHVDGGAIGRKALDVAIAMAAGKEGAAN